MGRVKLRRWGSRLVDLDILFYGDLVFDDGEIQVPHPEIASRHFVLYPLKDLDPKLIHPEFQMTISELASVVPQTLKIESFNPEKAPEGNVIC